MTTTSSPPSTAVLGLGAMGSAIARAARRAGAPVRVWNRTPRTLRDLGLDDGVTLADRPGDAVAGADLVVLCLRHHEAARDVLEQVADRLDGAVVVNVSTGTPAETVASARRGRELDVRYVTGAVMVPTPVVGTADCLVLCAGSEPDLAVAGPSLQRLLGGTVDLTGDDHAVPPALDLAMLDIYFAGMYAHLHATALAAAHGIAPERFLPYARGIVATLDGSLPGLTRAVQQRTWDTGEARLDMCLDFLTHVVSSSADAGIAPGLAAVVRDASARALARVPGSTDWDVVAEDFLTPGGAGQADR